MSGGVLVGQADPRGVSSRTVRIAYRAHLGEVLAVATRTLGLLVRAGVGLIVRSRTSSVGRSIHFTGRLLGALIPPGGKQLILEASSGGDGSSSTRFAPVLTAATARAIALSSPAR